MVNLLALTKKGLVSGTAKPKSAKKDNDSSKTCFNIVPYKKGLPPIGNIVLESSPSPSAHTYSNRLSTAVKLRPPTSKPFF